MTIVLVLVLLVLAVAAAAAAVATGRIGGGMGPATSTSPYTGLPEGEVRPEDVDAVRFSVGLRGYRMDEVDAVLARLREELRERDEELAAWREDPGDAAGDDAGEHGAWAPARETRPLPSRPDPVSDPVSGPRSGGE
ncbi:DivIVA domain-containing protein [Kineococcus xinjiangensis]|uniref:DivIVA domain-containing protein n=1 Tax=Kineococcus xinjiangensis TaxID=512762 RepID=A0A2S6IWS4_9ACTN|nr:DivIVA domain-containing protein [Kineococcus xinjiangensis]PPK98807.1 DivIVA domain-containing protein [Kineococcus xinjiangensis]